MAEEYRIAIVIEGKDRGASVSLGRVGGALSRVAEIATGILAARLLGRLGDRLMDLGREALEVTAKFERMELALQNLAARDMMAANSGMAMADALRASVGPAKELFKWSMKLAIHSPFTTEGVVDILKTAMAYGFTLKEAKKLTPVLLDLASGAGLTELQMRRVGYALGQVRAKGHLAGEEIRQLVNAGVPVNDILEQMGYSLQDVKRGAVDATEFIAAFTEYVNTNFAGAAERQTETWAGLLNTFHDLKELGLREFFSGLFDVLQPLAAKFSEWMQAEGLDRLRQWGENIGLMADAVKNLAEQDWDGLLSDLRQLGMPMDKAAGLVGFLRDAASAFDELTSRDLPGFLAGLRQELAPFQDEAEGVRQSWANLVDEIISREPEAEGAFRQLADYVRNTMWPGISEALQGILDDFGSTLDSMTELLRLKGDEGVSIVGDVLIAMAGVAGATLQLILGLVRLALEEIASTLKVVGDIMRGDWQAAWEDLKNTASTMGGTLKDTTSAIWDDIKGAIGEEALEGLKTKWATFWNDMSVIAQTQTPPILDVVDSTAGSIEERFSQMSDELVGHSIIPDMWAAIGDEFDDGTRRLTEIVQAWWANEKGYLQSLAAVWVRIAQGWMRGFSDTVLGALRHLKARVGAIIGSMIGQLNQLTNAMANVGAAAGQGFSQGMHQATMHGISQTVTQAVGHMRGLLGISSPSRVFMGIGEDTGEGFVIGLAKKLAVAGNLFAGLAQGVYAGAGAIPVGVGATQTVNQSWTWNFHNYGQGMDEEEFIRAVQVARFLAGAA